MFTLKHIILAAVLFHLFSEAHSQNRRTETFDELQANIDRNEKNGSAAMHWVQLYIRKSIIENNDDEQVHGYKMAIYYAQNNEQKLQFADQSITTALRSKDDSLIASAYSAKANVYYFHIRDYKEALNQFEMAQRYAIQAPDPYPAFKIRYHTGQLKLYLQYPKAALKDIKPCIDYFASKMNKSESKVLKRNYAKGYFNSVHLAAVAYSDMNDMGKVDSLAQEALLLMGKDPYFQLEKSYFLKCKGIVAFKSKDYSKAIKYLKASLPGLKQNHDFGWLSVVYFYLGEVLKHQEKHQEAVQYYVKVDSIYLDRGFILPELRMNYVHLIQYYQNSGDYRKEQFYSSQLLKIDTALMSNFQYIAGKIVNVPFPKMQNSVTKKRDTKYYVFSCILGVILIFLLYQLHFKKKNINSEQELVQPYKNEEVLAQLKKTLIDFEEQKLYRQKGLTIDKMALHFSVNRKQLADFIRLQKKVPFHTYLQQIRIQYIINLLNSDPKYLQFTVKSLADECGIASRQNFSDLFMQYTGMRPVDYIEMRKNQRTSQKKN